MGGNEVGENGTVWTVVVSQVDASRTDETMVQTGVVVGVGLDVVEEGRSGTVFVSKEEVGGTDITEVQTGVEVGWRVRSEWDF